MFTHHIVMNEIYGYATIKIVAIHCNFNESQIDLQELYESLLVNIVAIMSISVSTEESRRS